MSEHLTNITVVGLIERDGKIFIAKRAADKATFPDIFELVGGHVDPGEQPADALRREIEEELGIKVIVDKPFDAFTYESEGMFKVEICYLCHLEDSTTEPTINPADHSESRWIGSGEIDQFEKDDEETEALRRAFKLIEGDKS